MQISRVRQKQNFCRLSGFDNKVLFSHFPESMMIFDGYS